MVLTEAERVLAAAVEAGQIPGVVAMAADQREVLYAGAFGVAELGQPRPMRLDTVFAIASMTKAVTAVAAMQLVEQGRLTLDAPVGDALAELATVQVLEGFDASGEPRYRPPRRQITLRHLLTHTAGFAYTTWNAELVRWQASYADPPPFLEAPLVCDPGERWEYSISIDWVGRVIERVSGKSLEDYFRAHIFDPLGMPDTSYGLRPDQRARLATRHQRLADGSLHPVQLDIPDVPAAYNGGGGLHSTAPDYLRFLRMLLSRGELDGARVLRPATVDEMGRNHIGELTVGVLPSQKPESSNDAEFFPGMVKKWGLGGMINTRATAAGRSANSWAWAGLANTYFWLDPTRGVAGVVLTQILPFCDPPVLDLLDRFEQAIYGAQVPS